MADHHETQKPKPTNDLPGPSSEKISIGSSGGSKYPNRPETSIPDPATLREQWKYAIRQYSKWYSHAWGTAILAGVSFFALGWVIKGSNPLPSFQGDNKSDDKRTSDAAAGVAEESRKG